MHKAGSRHFVRNHHTCIMPWPPKIISAFADLPVGENQNYGSYNHLLYTLFPPDSDFVVSPSYLPSDIDGSEQYFASFEILFRQRAVLILQVKPPTAL